MTEAEMEQLTQVQEQKEQEQEQQEEEVQEEAIPSSTDELIKHILNTELNHLLTKAQSDNLSLDDARKLETLVKVVSQIDTKPITTNTGTISNEDLIRFLSNT